MPQTSTLPASTPYLAEAAPPGFQCTTSDGRFDSVRVHVAGELDLATATLLEETLRHAERHAPMVVLDLRELTFMDSAGLHVIVDATNRARQAQRRLVLVRGPSDVDRLFTMAGAAEVVDIADQDPGEDVQVPVRLARDNHAA